MGNSRESTSIIIIMPPGKMLLVVISRSLCECHMYAKAGLVTKAGSRWCLREELCPCYRNSNSSYPHRVRRASLGVHPVARAVASGPR